MKCLGILTAAALTSVALFSTPIQAEKIEAVTGSSSAAKQSKSIEQPAASGSTISPGGQSGGIKSAPLNPVTVTFPSTTSRGKAKASQSKRQPVSGDASK